MSPRPNGRREMDEGRRRFLIRAAAAVATGCGGNPRPSGLSGTCGSEGNGPGLGYCLVASLTLRVAGAAHFRVGQVAIMLLDDNTDAIVARHDQRVYALS